LRMARSAQKGVPADSGLGQAGLSAQTVLPDPGSRIQCIFPLEARADFPGRPASSVAATGHQTGSQRLPGHLRVTAHAGGAATRVWDCHLPEDGAKAHGRRRARRASRA
jgi:hypothetical protein